MDVDDDMEFLLLLERLLVLGSRKVGSDSLVSAGWKLNAGGGPDAVSIPWLQRDAGARLVHGERASLVGVVIDVARDADFGCEKYDPEVFATESLEGACGAFAMSGSSSNASDAVDCT